MWSAGVVLYEMLYGVRPFAHNMTAAQIWKMRQSIWRTDVSFPAVSPVTKTPISHGARRFVQRCLTREVSERPSVAQLLSDPWLVDSRKKKRTV